MNNYFKQDNYTVGVIVGIGTLIIGLGLVWFGLAIAHQPILPNVRLFGIAFIPLVLILRYYAKRKEQPKVTKTLIIVLFVTFIAYMAYLLSSKALTLQ